MRPGPSTVNDQTIQAEDPLRANRTRAGGSDQGLLVHGWTFRAENQFLPAEFRSSADPSALGDMEAEVRSFIAAGMDGFFTDHPDRGANAVR